MAIYTLPTTATLAEETKRTLVRRFSPDHSQRIRHTIQWAFVALNGWIGVQFYLWVRYFERGGQGLYVPRPAGVEGWLPIAGLMNLKYLFMTGHVPIIHPAAMYLFLGFHLMSTLLKKAFCSWLCPVGTLSENLWKLGRRLFKENLHLPKWLQCYSETYRVCSPEPDHRLVAGVACPSQAGKAL